MTIIDALIECNQDIPELIKSKEAEEGWLIRDAIATAQGFTNMSVVQASSVVVSKNRGEWRLYAVPISSEERLKAFAGELKKHIPKIKINVLYRGQGDGLQDGQRRVIDSDTGVESIIDRAKEKREDGSEKDWIRPAVSAALMSYEEKDREVTVDGEKSVVKARSFTRSFRKERLLVKLERDKNKKAKKS